MTQIKKGLGKGLGALIAEQPEIPNDNVIVQELDINKVEPNRNQPRKNFDEDNLIELSESIKNFGIIQPLLVKKTEDFYEIVAGERRYRAARIAGLKKIPAIIKEASELESLQISLIENIQRQDLNAIEEAETYKRLIDEFGMTQDAIAEKVGKNRSTITNMLRLNNLDSRVRLFVMENKITAGHARALLSVQDKDLEFELAERIIEENLSVRETEEITSAMSALSDAVVSMEKQNKTQIEDDINLYKEIQTKIENDLKKIFGTKVKIHKGKNKGKIEIEYYSSDDLDRLMTLIRKIDD